MGSTLPWSGTSGIQTTQCGILLSMVQVILRNFDLFLNSSNKIRKTIGDIDVTVLQFFITIDDLIFKVRKLTPTTWLLEKVYYRTDR